MTGNYLRFAGIQARSTKQDYRGYDFQARHPIIRASIDLPLSAGVDLTRIDAWLSGPFDLDSSRMLTNAHPPKDGPLDALAAAVAQRLLLLFGDLLRAAGVPCFDDGQLLAVRPLPHRPNDRQVILAVPVIDHVSVNAFEIMLRRLANLVLTQFIKEPKEALIQGLLKHVDQTIVRKLADSLHFNSSTLPICRLAHSRGIPYRHIGNGFFILGLGAKSMITRGSAVMRDSAIGSQICSFKQITADILRAAGLPCARHYVVDTPQAALSAALEIGWPVVVKPSNLERSQGVTVDVADEAALLIAYDRAFTNDSQVMIEKQEPGICHRIMVAGGELVYTVIRYPKGVMGNGRDSIGKLAAAANELSAAKPRWRRLKDVPLDEEALACLTKQGYSLDSVPSSGQRVFVRAITSGEWGGDIENLSGSIHPANVDLAVTAAGLLGLTVAGIDLMTVDVTRPWFENDGTIIEVNFDPQFATVQREKDAPRILSVIDGDGRIPVWLVTGDGNLLTAARTLRDRRAAQGAAAHLTTARHSESSAGAEIVMPTATLFERGLALAMRPDVEELILVGRPDEIGLHGLPVDRIQTAYIHSSDQERSAKLAERMRCRFAIDEVIVWDDLSNRVSPSPVN